MNASNALTEVAYSSLEKAKIAFFVHTLAEGYALLVLQTRRVGNRNECTIKALILNFSNSRRTNRTVSNIACQRATGITATECMFHASIREEVGAWQAYVENRDHNNEDLTD